MTQTIVEPYDPLPLPADPMPVYNPPPEAEFEVINPPDNYQGPVTNVTPPQPFVAPNVSKFNTASL
jgi:hypothetical protein